MVIVFLYSSIDYICYNITFIRSPVRNIFTIFTIMALNIYITIYYRGDLSGEVW